MKITTRTTLTALSRSRGGRESLREQKVAKKRLLSGKIQLNQMRVVSNLRKANFQYKLLASRSGTK